MCARMNPYRDFCPQSAFAASVTCFTCLSTACVWQGNFGKMTVGVTSVVMRYLSSEYVIAMMTGGFEIGQTVQSIMSKYSTASKLSFAGTLNLRICLCNSGLHHSSQAQFTYMWSMVRHHGQEQILRVSKVRITVNGGVNDRLKSRAEVS